MDPENADKLIPVWGVSRYYNTSNDLFHPKLDHLHRIAYQGIYGSGISVGGGGGAAFGYDQHASGPELGGGPIKYIIDDMCDESIVPTTKDLKNLKKKFKKFKNKYNDTFDKLSKFIATKPTLVQYFITENMSDIRNILDKLSIDNYSIMSYNHAVKKMSKEGDVIDCKILEVHKLTKRAVELYKLNKPGCTTGSFMCPIGLEYTFHPIFTLDTKKDTNIVIDINKAEDGDELDLVRRNKASKTLNKLKNKMLHIINPNENNNLVVGSYDNTRAKMYKDGTCIEVCSPIHKDWDSMVTWYNKMVSLLGSSVRPTSQKYPSGGTHVNCSIPRNHSVKYMYNLIIDTANRPYLNWVFNDPCDNKTSNWMFHVGSFGECGISIFVFSKDTESFVIDNMDLWNVNDATFLETLNRKIMRFGSRQQIIRVKNEFHYEFRCFTAVRNERDLMDIVTFVDAYCKYIYGITASGGCVSRKFKGDFIDKMMLVNETDTISTESIKRAEEIDEFTDVDNVRKNFNAFIRLIGLDPKNYKRFVDRNYEQRRSIYGKTHFI